MRKGLLKILVTGGAGFIGSEFLRQLIRDDSHNIGQYVCREPSLCVVDKLTYAGDLRRLEEVKGKFKFYKTDICNKKQIESIFAKEKPDIVAHFAAESHVDRSINNVSPFIDTNIKGTQVLLDVSRKYKISKFVFLSTDEVYGEILHGKFSECSPLKPNSPYAASKAAGDLLVQSYIRTYKFPAIIVRPCNNFGPWQYPEKLIPVVISKALKNQKVPVYAKGQNVREWLYVCDCAKAILTVLKRGKIGQVYNIGSGQEEKNITLVKEILKIMHKPSTLIEFVKDRPGHDLRYSLNYGKISQELNWKPQVNFDSGIALTVDWYIKNQNWLILKGKHS